MSASRARAEPRGDLLRRRPRSRGRHSRYVDRLLRKSDRRHARHRSRRIVERDGSHHSARGGGDSPHRLDALMLDLFTQCVESMTWLEAFGFVTGVACVYLAARENVWNWPIAILNSAAYLVVFLRTGLYSDTLLQLVY